MKQKKQAPRDRVNELEMERDDALDKNCQLEQKLSRVETDLSNAAHERRFALKRVAELESALLDIYRLTSNEHGKVGGLIRKVFNCSRLEMAEKVRRNEH